MLYIIWDFLKMVLSHASSIYIHIILQNTKKNLILSNGNIKK